MKKIPAPIDEKNVTTDWLESIFDYDCFARDVRTMIGIIKHCVVKVSWDYNRITWEISKDISTGDTIDAYMILEERLKAAESGEQNIFSIIQHGESGRLQIVQTFFFRAD